MEIGDRVQFTDVAKNAFGDVPVRQGTVTQAAADGVVEVLADGEKSPHWWPATFWGPVHNSKPQPR